MALEHPDVAIVDIKMPPTYTDEGLVAAEEIRNSYPDVGILVLSQYLEPRCALRLLERYPERVGYLLKERVSDVAVLADAIRRIAEGECVLDPTIVARLVNRPRRQSLLYTLTDREREVLALIAEGRSNMGISQVLVLSPKTVEPTLAVSSRSWALSGPVTITAACSPCWPSCARSRLSRGAK